MNISSDAVMEFMVMEINDFLSNPLILFSSNWFKLGKGLLTPKWVVLI